MTNNPLIRTINDDDIEQVVVLWRAANVARPWNDPATDIAFARRGPHSTVLVAARDAEIIATAMIGEDGHRGWVYYLAAAPDYRRTGLGRAMMAAAENWLAKRGVWKVQLLIRGDNAAVKEFYEHLGYRDTGSVCFQKIIAPIVT